RIDPEFEHAFEELSKEQQNRLKNRQIKFGEVESRIAAICEDIAVHYRANFEPDGFKAQVAVCSQRAAEIYHQELEARLGPRVAVLISGTQEKKSSLNDLRDKFQPEELWIEKLKT